VCAASKLLAKNRRKRFAFAEAKGIFRSQIVSLLSPSYVGSVILFSVSVLHIYCRGCALIFSAVVIVAFARVVSYASGSCVIIVIVVVVVVVIVDVALHVVSILFPRPMDLFSCKKTFVSRYRASDNSRPAVASPSLSLSSEEKKTNKFPHSALL